MHDVTLTVNGKQHSGWESLNINLGVEQIAGTFELSVTEKWPGNNEARPIRRGEVCTVSIDGEIVITGYVDDVLPSYDSNSHTLTINGRDKTADLVDCSAIYKTGAWTNTSLKTIAEDLCKPFGIGVIINTDIGEPFKHAADAQSEARRMMAENIPIPDLKPKRDRSGKAKPSPGSVGQDERLRSNRGNQLGTFART